MRRKLTGWLCRLGLHWRTRIYYQNHVSVSRAFCPNCEEWLGEEEPLS